MRWNRRDNCRDIDDGWRRWFAWHPVEVKNDDEGTVESVWLETIERRVCGGPPDDPSYEYRNITSGII